MHIQCTSTSCKGTSQTASAFSKHQYLLLRLLMFLLNVKYASSFTFPQHRTCKSNILSLLCISFLYMALLMQVIYKNCWQHSLLNRKHHSLSLPLFLPPLFHMHMHACMHAHTQSMHVWEYHTLKCRQHNFRPTCLANIARTVFGSWKKQSEWKLYINCT